MSRTARRAATGKIECLRRSARLWLSCASTIALILCGAAATLAQSASSAPAVQSAKHAAPARTSAEAPAKATAPTKGMNSGIKVHGHWTIDVLNHDGTLAKHVEFENGLTLVGAEALPLILGRTATPGAWAIGLGYSDVTGESGPGPCTYVSFNLSLYLPSHSIFVPTPWRSESMGGACFIAESIAGTGGSAAGYAEACGSNICFSSLSVSVVQAQTTVGLYNGSLGYNSWPAPQNQLQLQGTATAQNDGTIDTVATYLMLCAASSGSSAISPATCATGNLTTTAASNFSFATLGGASDAFSQLGQGSPPFGNSITGTYLVGSSATSTPPAPIGVLATQVLRVTVLLSFS